MLEVNMKVTLNEAGLRYVQPAKGVPAHRKGYPVWNDRRGVLMKMSRCKTKAYILWDGTKHVGCSLPIKFLSPV